MFQSFETFEPSKHLAPQLGKYLGHFAQQIVAVSAVKFVNARAIPTFFLVVFYAA
jgi:hypothetical protein